MYSRPNLPDSLKRKQCLKIISRVLPCLFLLIVDFYIIKYWGGLFKSKYDIGNIIFKIALVIFPFIITGVPLKLFDSFWSGELSEISVEEKIGTESIGGRPWPYTKNDLILTIIMENGKKIKYKEISLAIKDPHLFVPNTGDISNYSSKYHKGDMLHKYYGFSHPFSENSDEKICIVCGNVNKSTLSACSFCQSALLSCTNDRQS